MTGDLQFDVVGGDGPRAYFSALTRETIAHAYIFSGEPGVGKRTFARRLAQSLLCESRKEGVLGYDASCRSCRLFVSGARHPDFLEHDGTLKIGERDAAAHFGGDELSARDVVRQLSMESYSGGMRVLLLGDLDFATHHAANALLKFFEEPPAGVVLLITTPSPGRVIATIRSRALEVRFALLTRTEVTEILRRKGYDAGDAEKGAHLSQGSVTRALAALEGEQASVRALAANWFFSVAAGATPTESWATRETLDAGLETIKGLVRDWAALRYTKSEPLSGAYAEALRSLPPLSSSALDDVLTHIAGAQRLARTNVSPAMASELVRMALTGKASR